MNYISKFKNLYLLVFASLAFFFLKGVDYAFLGSYVPIGFIGLILIMLCLSFSKSVKAHRGVLKFWAGLLLLWAIVRIGFAVLLYFDDHLTESHLREHFSLLQNVISGAMMIIGIGIFKQLKKSGKEHS